MNDYNTIPLPPFSVLDFVKKQTEDFIITAISPRQFHINDDDGLIKKFLWKLNTREHRLQALSILINRTVEDLNKHIIGDLAKSKIPCQNTREGCSFEKGHHKTLYILYGLIKDYNVNPYTDTFTAEEIYSNNQKLDYIIETLELIKGGQEIIFDEIEKLAIDQAKHKVNEAKELQILGKQKWQTFIVGLGIQLAAQGAISRVYADQLAPHFESLVTFINKLN